MQAVILAAGLGSRIREYHALPKGFICVGKEPIIVESIAKLKRQGITDILLVTGYRSECYESLAKTDASISTVHNPEYQNSGSLYSLYCAKDWVNDDFLLLESDLLYEERALSVLCKGQHETEILLSGPTDSGDEVYVQADAQQLVNMSKQVDSLNKDQIYGEFVGINKLSFQDYQQLIALLDDDSSLLMSGHYEEQGLVALAKQKSVYCLKIPDLLWCEIDNTDHLKKAQEKYSELSQNIIGI